ncbi:molybdenum cofactor biosynthesis protein MoaE [Populibacterium corticicola]|uniref:Molybdenum cofactor biosynthesis protein MoaE n=1 Tax=Populibacterium corticicola TaxID=1812826 RepID=A0ABW5XCF9_9MICO
MTEESVVVLTSITTDELNVTHHENLVADPRMGAVVSFGGVVRNHDSRAGVTRLEYEGHPQAAKTLTEIADDLALQFPGVRIAVSHRVGALEVGHIALAAAVASAHRAEAFGCCAQLVEEIKTRLPIWKNQFFDDGTQEWVGSL